MLDYYLPPFYEHYCLHFWKFLRPRRHWPDSYRVQGHQVGPFFSTSSFFLLWGTVLFYQHTCYTCDL